MRDAIAETFGDGLASRPGFGEFVTVLLSSMRGPALIYTLEPREPPMTDPTLAVCKRLMRLYLGGEHT